MTFTLCTCNDDRRHEKWQWRKINQFGTSGAGKFTITDIPFIWHTADRDQRNIFDKMLKFIVHDDVIKWKHFPRYWPFVRGIQRSPMNSPHKGQWRGALMFSLICAWTNGWANHRHAGDLRRHRVHYDVTVMTNGAGILRYYRNTFIVLSLMSIMSNIHGRSIVKHEEIILFLSVDQ